jgi:hypothetical protein
VQSRFKRVAHTPNVCRYDLTHLQGASSAPTHASSRRVPRKRLRVSVRGTSAPAMKHVQKGPATMTIPFKTRFRPIGNV